MDKQTLATIFAQLGASGLAVIILAKVIDKAATRIVKGFDNMAARFLSMEERSVELRTEVKTTLARLEGKIDGMMDEQDRWQDQTPVSRTRGRPPEASSDDAPPRRLPGAGAYGPLKPR